MVNGATQPPTRLGPAGSTRNRGQLHPSQVPQQDLPLESNACLPPNSPIDESSPRGNSTGGKRDVPARERSDIPADQARRRPTLVVVGIGTSAGGLPALKTFFAAAKFLDAAIVVIQHLDPTEPSAMQELLRTHTPMRLAEAKDGELVEAGRVYLLPPGKTIEIRNGALRLEQRPAGPGLQLPVDRFFRSLAAEQRDRAIAVILTGTGSDGAVGVREVKANGGLVLVQDVTSAEHAGMPQAAIDTGAADGVLSIESIAHRIAAHIASVIDDEDTIADDAKDLRLILETIAWRGGPIDFSAYKVGTLKRRVERRMALRGMGTMAQYAALLERDTTELEKLSKDFLVGVTEFFRDPDAFTTLQREVIPRLFNEETARGAIRVWVSACSTGEEAYSIAMLLLEAAKTLDSKTKLQVFASDANAEAIEFARKGTYTTEVLAGVSSERLATFFDKEGSSHYRVKKEVRNAITFSEQNLLQDPPFSRLDLICCRNVLIYLDSNAQRNLAATFHFALRPGAFLFMGASENVPPGAPFELISQKWRIYRRDLAPANSSVALATRTYPMDDSTVGTPPGPRVFARVRTPTDLANEWLLSRYAPAAVIINRNNDIVSFHGPIERYLDMPKGPATLNILALPKQGILARLRSTIQQAIERQDGVHTTGATIHRDGVERPVDIRVEPLRAAGTAAGLLIVIFEESATTPIGPALPGTLPRTLTDEVLMRQLEEDLKSAKRQIDEMAEYSEAANEELKAANEEMTSMNEELRSANEELQSSKEELQSLNEELHQTNDELKNKIEKLTFVTDDLVNYQRAAGIPMIALDRQLRTTSTSPLIERLIHFTPSDLGRPLADIKWRFDDDQLLTDAMHVMENLVPIEKEVTIAGRRLTRRILPYRTVDDRINGVVITFVDIEAASRKQDDADAALASAEAVIDMVREPLLILSSKARILKANESAYSHLGLDREHAIGQTIYDAIGDRWDATTLREIVNGLAANRGSGKDTMVNARDPNAPALRVTGRRMPSTPDAPLLLSVVLAPDAKKDPARERA